ncbi:MAG: reverse transcriptase family protein, partial [Giesbergeria sp.]|uniref:RNA-directed DNA polymerase n=1 Tax=Giesbergeria sp. TaxID=2818473 RepID=UPI00260405DC
MNVANYRRISLIDVESKAFLLILLDRIRLHLDAQLLDEQFGFRPARGPGDGQQCMTRLVELAAAHGVPLHAGFVDFKQAFDSLDRGVLWEVLRVYRIHPKLISLLEDLYQGSTACVRANGSTSGQFHIHSGVRQGCPLSPVLFNVYMDFVIRIFQHRCHSQGISGFSVAYTIPGVGVRVACQGVRDLALLLYADDLVLLAPSRHQLVAALNLLEEVASEWGLIINFSKTEVMVINPAAAQSAPGQPQQTVQLGTGRHVQIVDHFRYLGILIDSSGDQGREIQRRISSAEFSFRTLKPVLLAKRGMSLSTKMLMFKTFVVPALTYAGPETWLPRHDLLQRVRTSFNSMLRR